MMVRCSRRIDVSASLEPHDMPRLVTLELQLPAAYPRKAIFIKTKVCCDLRASVDIAGEQGGCARQRRRSGEITSMCCEREQKSTSVDLGNWWLVRRRLPATSSWDEQILQRYSSHCSKRSLHTV
ncbi:hypothetical protein MRB53_040229 [Persea americana]|nr:hypothetical protein MRB53_040229 [Persea americana]